MTSNLKSGNAVVRLLLAHGEKLGILAILICTGMIVWSALGRERMEKEPSQLDNLAKTTQSQLASFTWDDVPPQEQVRLTPLPPTAMVEIKSEAFPILPSSFNPRVSDPVSLRTDPLLLSAMDLEVNADSGLWLEADPAVIRQRMLDALKEQREEERERNELRERATRDGETGRRGGPGAGGERMGLGEGYGRPGRGPGGDRNRKPSKDDAIVVRPRGGVQLQGFEDIKAKSWVTVLAKIPVEDQYKLYDDALQTSRGYNARVDIPIYKGYQVDRAEITDQGLGEWQKIAVINADKLLKEIQTYPVNAPDVIDPDVKHPLLTHPLPPLILREWGERVSHSSMPLAIEKAEQEAEAMKEELEEDDAPEEATGEEDLFAEAEDPRVRGGRGPGGIRGMRGGAPGGRGYGGGEMGGDFGRMGMGRGEFRGGGYGRGYGGGEMGGYGGEMGGMTGSRGGFGGMRGSMGRGADETLAEFVWDHETPHVLFRYFDNTVMPGRSYKYRVRLVMRDVNHSTKPQYLDKSVSERREASGNKSYRWTDWSEPSPVASVPLPARIYLLGAKPVKENSYTSEPKVDLLIKALDATHASEVARQESFGRGSVINIFDKAKVIWANKWDAEEFPSFRFLTGVTVLDFTGGDKLSRDMQSTARALLMDAAGHLHVQDEIDDLETVDEYNEIIESASERRGRGGFGGGRGGGFGGEMGGYGRGEMGGFGGRR